jgi:hypothetical protein
MPPNDEDNTLRVAAAGGVERGGRKFTILSRAVPRALDDPSLRKSA